MKASGNFAVGGINKRLVCKSYTESDILQTEEWATLSEKFSKMILTCELLLKVRKNFMIADHGLR